MLLMALTGGAMATLSTIFTVAETIGAACVAVHHIKKSAE